MSSPFTDFTIMPNYSKGFCYSWELSGDFNDPGPWKFEVQKGQAPKGPWRVISPELVNACFWQETEGGLHKVDKANVLYFRMHLKTGNGDYYSASIQPYGSLSRHDFLIAREIMRQAVLHSKGMAGVPGQAYLLSTFGPRCKKCLDPITGNVRDSHCKYCFGTGRDPAYNGPYDLWLDFSEDSQHQTDTDKNGTIEKKSFQVKAIGNPVLKYGDVLVVPSTDKRYHVRIAHMTSEMRRVPIIQTLEAEEAPQTDKIYDI